MERAVVRKAKRLAKARKTSVSAIMSQFVNSVTSKDSPEERLSPIVREITGIGKIPPDKDYKELLTDALMEKYGIKE
jgi:hypothetical protein